VLLGGGSGLVPLMAMLRERAAAASAVPARLLVSARSREDLLYADELDELAAGGLELTVTLTRRAPDGWSGPTRRVDRAMLEAFAPPPAEAPRIYVCGPTSFVELAAAELVALGHDPAGLRLERFGATGG
jgi:ferredoxin-NADP reductase